MAPPLVLESVGDVLSAICCYAEIGESEMRAAVNAKGLSVIGQMVAIRDAVTRYGDRGDRLLEAVDRFNDGRPPVAQLTDGIERLRGHVSQARDIAAQCDRTLQAAVPVTPR